MSAGPKAAAFAVFLRVFMTAFEPIASRWEPLVWLSALLSMIIGNFAALTQTNIKRLLAYSSIAHAGYVLVAVTAHSEIGTAAAMFYLAAYAFMNIGAFAVVTHFSRQGREVRAMSTICRPRPNAACDRGAADHLPAVADRRAAHRRILRQVLHLQSRAGAKLVWLTVLGLLNSAVAAYYYLRIMVVMYMQEPGEATLDCHRCPASRTTLWAAAPGR